MKSLSIKRLQNEGFILPAALTFIIVMIIVSGTVLGVIQNNLFQVNNNERRQKAFNIAEAGLNYYLWHLSHSPSDFKDGQSTPSTQDPNLGYGPYVHQYVDDNGVNQGTFTLWIKPQGNGSSIATVRSIGKLKNHTTNRTIEAQLGAPSFASYALAADSPLWFGDTEAANGPVHSNVGIRMDGDSNSDVTSANTTYVPPSNLGGNGFTSQPGVWCNSSIISPVNCNTRNKSDWRFPVPSVDFNQVNGSLCSMKKQAFSSDPSTQSIALQANACSQTPTTRTSAYLPQRASNGSYSISRGYLIQLNDDGSYDLFAVNGEDDTKATYTNALTRQTLGTGLVIPDNGVIFAEDNVWVRTNTKFPGRVTIATGRLATSSKTNIVIADDVEYTSRDGSAAIGLIAEDSVIVAPYALPASGNFNFQLNAAIIAQAGDVVYPSRYRSANTCTKGWVNSGQTFSFYGAIATRQSWTWTWLLGGFSCGNAVFEAGKGYISGPLNNTTQYDYNLLYAPPPSFPLTSGFNILSWREVLTVP